MAVERRDPLPPGRYSVFLKPDEGERFRAWAKAHGVVIVAAFPREVTRSNTPIWSISATGQVLLETVGESVLFDVTRASPWIGFGFPTIETGIDTTMFINRELYVPPEPTALSELGTIALVGMGVYLLGQLLISRK